MIGKRKKNRELIIIKYDQCGQSVLPYKEDFLSILIGLKDLIRAFIISHYGMLLCLVLADD